MCSHDRSRSTRHGLERLRSATATDNVDNIAPKRPGSLGLRAGHSPLALNWVEVKVFTPRW